MPLTEEQKAKARAYWHEYRQKPEKMALIKARRAAEYRDPVLCRAKHAREKERDRAGLQRRRRTSDRRKRAITAGVPFALPSALEPEVPSTCCMCGEAFGEGNRRPDLDRVVPKLGYVPGNVYWIHHECNSFKRDLTIEEARVMVSGDPRATLLVSYLERCTPLA